MKKVGVVAVFAACGLFLFGPSSCTCTQAACFSGVGTTLTVAGDPASLAGSVVTVCRNDDCRDGVLELSSDGTELSCVFEGDDAIFGRECRGVVSGSDVSIQMSLTIADEKPSEDDTFRFVVASAHDPDDVLAEAEGKPDEYEDFSPNGEWCGPTCYQGTI